jgi:CDP-diacylglycerol--glycerol-3-phosphate 3-phosphatidyltransferase
MAKFKQKVLDLAQSRAQYLSKVTVIDRVIRFLFLGLIPKSVTPNQITVFRFVSIPFIVVLLLDGHYLSATIIFLFSALSDALDGALARTTGQITRWGILADPLADKLLVGSVSLILISKFLSWHLALAIVLIEVFTVASAYFRYAGRVISAKTPAKIKMILQCFGIIFLFFFILFGGGAWLVAARVTLYLAVVFGLLSLLLYKSI